MDALTTQATEIPQAVAAPCNTTAEEKPVVAFGPWLQAIGVWEWIGADLAEELSGHFRAVTFREEIPPCDLLVIVKYPPPAEWLDLPGLRPVDESTSISITVTE